jgi:hypothetical protein
VVTSISRDAASAWYNSDGLGNVKHCIADLNATAFSFRVRVVPQALELTTPSGNVLLIFPAMNLFRFRMHWFLHDNYAGLR